MAKRKKILTLLGGAFVLASLVLSACTEENKAPEKLRWSLKFERNDDNPTWLKEGQTVTLDGEPVGNIDDSETVVFETGTDVWASRGMKIGIVFETTCGEETWPFTVLTKEEDERLEHEKDFGRPIALKVRLDAVPEVLTVIVDNPSKDGATAHLGSLSIPVAAGAHVEQGGVAVGRCKTGNQLKIGDVTTTLPARDATKSLDWLLIDTSSAACYEVETIWYVDSKDHPAAKMESTRPRRYKKAPAHAIPVVHYAFADADKQIRASTAQDTVEFQRKLSRKKRCR